MKATEAFDATIRKFQGMVEGGERPDWIIGSCPLCKHFLCDYCPLQQLEPYGCGEIAVELGIYNNAPEILQMLGQVRIYLYGQKGLIRR